MVEVKIKCVSCGNEVAVGTHNIKKSMFIPTDGEYLWMTYFECPECSRRNFVQVDNMDTNALVEADTKLVIRAMKQKRLGKTLHRKQSERHKQIERDLAESRKALMLSVSGKMVIDCETMVRYVAVFNDTTSMSINN